MNLLPQKHTNLRSHPALRNPNDVHDASLSVTERFCQRVADATGAPLTLLLVIVFQLIWIVVGHMTKMDPYPFVFMLTISNVVQLILIVVIAVAGKQSTAHAETRAEEDHAALSRLLYHQQAQEKLLLELAEKNGIDVKDVADAIAKLSAPLVPAPGTVVAP